MNSRRRKTSGVFTIVALCHSIVLITNNVSQCAALSIKSSLQCRQLRQYPQIGGHQSEQHCGRHRSCCFSTQTNNGESFLQYSNNTLYEVDLRQSDSSILKYDVLEDRYVHDNKDNASTITKSSQFQILPRQIKNLLKLAFLPEGVTASYYRYMKFRILQRYISSVVHVLGTQSLLLGLGFRGSRTLGVSAAMYWVLKDALGKIARMVWASRMGGRFDSDAKRWRFRASLLFAMGNGLEVATYIAPQWFLLLATLANANKQIGMLTSSATRNALYNTFKVTNAKTENIGDITAKGEAQIAIVDLLGIGSGVALSRAIGVSVRSVFTVWISLQILEILFMYQEIRSVVFRKLNFERLWTMADRYVSHYNENPNVDKTEIQSILPTPEEMASNEHLFLPPKYLARRANAFGSLGRAKLSPSEMDQLRTIFAKEKFLLIVGANQKKLQRRKFFFRRSSSKKSIRMEENCHIVLHADANNADIVKSTVALAILRRKLADYASTVSSSKTKLQELRSSDCLTMISESREIANHLFPQFLKAIHDKNWETPSRFMFGRVRKRAVWTSSQAATTTASKKGHHQNTKKNNETTKLEMTTTPNGEKN